LSRTLDFLIPFWHWHHVWRSLHYFDFRLLSRRINWLVGDIFIMPYLNFILIDNKVSHSVEITPWIRYIDNTLSEIIKSIYTSFRNGKKSEHLMSLYYPFRSNWKLIRYFPTIYVYCIYRIMSKAPKQLSNCLKRADTSVVLIVFYYVLCEVHAYKIININAVTVFFRRSTGYQKTISWSVTKYNKKSIRSMQCDKCRIKKTLTDGEEILPPIKASYLSILRLRSFYLY
jgi:hypothetical protein